MSNLLQEGFLRLAPTSDKWLAQGYLDRLIERYMEPHRFYHTLQHIEGGLEVYYATVSTPLSRPHFFAWAYHDSAYDTKASDNEERSAEIFLRDASNLGFSMAEADQIATYIIATNPSATPISVVNDIDLTGLGASPEVFDRNTANIRLEYDWVEPEVWRKGRTAVLRQFLMRSQLYLTAPFVAKFTQPAIENMKRALILLNS
jgi:predicted metal-dependent HD superfamily phosphohydrolase